MRLLTLLFALQLFCTPSFAQTKTERAQVQWGPDLVSNKNGSFDKVFGNTDEHIYMTVVLKKEVFVQKMDLDNKSVYQKLLPMKIDKVEHAMERILLFGEKILVFTTHYDKKSKSNDLFLRVFNESNMAPEGRLKKLASIDVENKKRKGGFDVVMSPDESRILVGQQLPFEKEVSERFRMSVYDEEMNTMWERDVTMPYLDSEFSVSDMRLADDGSVIVIGRRYAEKQEARELKKEGRAHYEYHLVTYDADGGEPQDNALQVQDKFLHDLALHVGSEGDILAGGFYGLKGANAVHGVFFLKLDRATKQILHSNFKEFDREFITAYMTEKEESKATKKADRKGEEMEMLNFELRDIIRRTDGGAVMVGEQYNSYTTTTCTTVNGRQSCTTTYHYVYNDIIVVNVDPAGTIAWAAKVPKRQHTTNDGGYYSSFALAVNKDKIHLMFNDSGKNLFLTQGQKVEPFKLTGKEALITLATIEDNGVVHREALLAPDRRDAITRPRSCVQLSDDRMFIFAARKKDYRFGSMVFQ